MYKKLILLLTLLIVLLGLIMMPRVDKPQELPENNEPVVDEDDSEKDLPEVVIILDDLGNNYQTEREIDQINASVTLAVLPFRQDTPKVLNHFSERELILHLPLEPMESKYFEEKMLMTDMNGEEIKTEFKKYLNNLDSKIVGVNNHKGSRFTSNEDCMKTLLETVKENNLYFIDSYTIASSVGFDLARQMNVPTVRRDIFLDNSKKEEDIKEQLGKLIKKAEQEGSAIALGHAYPETISVLIEELPALKERVNFVNASEIVK